MGSWVFICCSIFIETSTILVIALGKAFSQQKVTNDFARLLPNIQGLTTSQFVKVIINGMIK